MHDYKNLEEKKISSQNVYDGVLLHVKCDKIKMPSGNIGIREYFNHPGASCVVAITEDEQIIIEKQFRYPFHSVITEIPAGKLDLNEDPLSAAKREFEEETGYIADKWTYMGDFYPSVAYTDENIRMYLAQDIHQGKQRLDDDEFLNIHFVPFKKFYDDVLNGKIKDGKTVAAVLKAKEYLNKQL